MRSLPLLLTTWVSVSTWVKADVGGLGVEERYRKGVKLWLHGFKRFLGFEYRETEVRVGNMGI